MPDWEAAEKAKKQGQEESKTPGPEKAVHTDSLVDSSANSQKIQSLQESGGPQTDSVGSVSAGTQTDSVGSVSVGTQTDRSDPGAGENQEEDIESDLDPEEGEEQEEEEEEVVVPPATAGGGDSSDPEEGGTQTDPVETEEAATQTQVSDKIRKARIKKAEKEEKKQKKWAKEAEREREKAEDKIEKYKGIVEAVENAREQYGKAQGSIDAAQDKIQAYARAAEELKREQEELAEARNALNQATNEAERREWQEAVDRRLEEVQEAERVCNTRNAEVRAALAGVEEAKKAKDAASDVIKAGQKTQEKQETALEERAEAMRVEQLATVRADAIHQVKEDAANYPTNGEGEDPQDAFNTVLMSAVLQSGKMEVEPGGGEADNRKFDTLADLKNLDQEAPQDGEADTDDLKRARKDVHKLRKGNLYKAVIMARILAPGNLSSEKELKEQKKAAEKPDNFGRFSRFFDKGIDVVGKFGKTASAVSGIKALGDKDYGKSKMFTAISIASDVKALAGAIWGITKKLRALIKKKVEKGVDTALTVIGLFADVSTVAAKIASMTKSIGSLHNMSNINKTICSIVSDAATLLSQVLGLAGTCDAIDKLRKRKKKLEEDQKKEQENVRMIIDGGGGPDDKDKKGSKEDTSESKKDGEGDIPEDKKVGEEDNPKDKKNGEEAAPEGEDKKNKKYKKDKDLTDKVVEILSDPYIELTEEQRATLASYLARDKVIIKKGFAIFNTSIGLATNLLGIISVSTKTWKDSEDLKKMKDEEENGKKEEPDDEEKTRLERAADITAFNTNVATIASSAAMPLIVTGRDVLSQNVGKKPELIKEGLWGALTSLGKDEYGLRGIANGLTKKESEQESIDKTGNAVEQYGKVEKQLDGADVDYSKLFAAETQEKFKDALIAGI